MIEQLVQQRGLKAVKVAGTHGGEYACPCPACGGKDRFRFWPAQGEGGTWYCRQCGKGGDCIQFLRDFEGLSYAEACRRLGRERAPLPTSIMPRRERAREWTPAEASLPCPAWREHAAKLLDYAHQRLLGDDVQLMRLAMRGIERVAVERYRLGWLPGEKGKDGYHRDRGAWGLPPETNARGRKKSLWIPSGLVIPALDDDGAVLRLRIRRDEEARARFGADMKYVVVPGSSMRPLLLRPEARAFVVVESELDAIACAAAAESAGLDVGAFAAGTSLGRPDTVAHAVLRRALCILVALDFDQPDAQGQRAGARGMPFWAQTYRTARRWPVPSGKDPGDAVREGWNIADWLRIGLPPVFAQTAPQSADVTPSRALPPEREQARETMPAGQNDDQGGETEKACRTQPLPPEDRQCPAVTAAVWGRGGAHCLTHPIGPLDSLKVLARAGVRAIPTPDGDFRLTGHEHWPHDDLPRLVSWLKRHGEWVRGALYGEWTY